MAGALMTPGRTGAQPGRGRRRSRPPWRAGASCRVAPAASTSCSPAARSSTCRSRWACCGCVTAGPGGRDVVVDALEGQRLRPLTGSRRGDGDPVVVGAVPHLPAEEAGVEAGEGAGVGAVEGHDVEGDVWSAERWFHSWRTTLGVTTDTGLLDFCRPAAQAAHVAAQQRPGPGRLLLGVVDVEGHPQPPGPLGRDDPVLGEQRRAPASSAARARMARPAGSSPAPAAKAASTARAWACSSGTPTRSSSASEDAVPTQACHPGETSNRRASAASRSGVP